MSSLASRAIFAVLPLRGSKKRLSSVEDTLADVAARQLRPEPPGPPKRLLRKVDITVSRLHGWQVYNVSPTGTTPARAALYLHGGAYVREISPRQWNLVGRLAATSGTRFIVPIYPLAPTGTAAEVVPPLTDMAAALVASIGPERAFMIGDSSGGGMALAVALQLRDRGLSPPARTVLISPWLDLTLSDPAVESIAPRDPLLAAPGLRAVGDLYRGDLPADSPMVSPINGNLTGLGPITLISGTRDILNADAHRLVALAKPAGLSLDFHEAPNMLHGYPTLPMPEAKQARAIVASTLTA